jgi:putative aminopeptidase FrvX
LQNLLIANFGLLALPSISTSKKLADNKMKIEILHNVFGSITMDEEGKIEVRKPDLAERLTYLLAHFDELGDQVQRYGAGDQGRLIAVLEYIGLAGGITKVTTEEEPPLPPGTVY